MRAGKEERKTGKYRGIGRVVGHEEAPGRKLVMAGVCDPFSIHRGAGAFGEFQMRKCRVAPATA